MRTSVGLDTLNCIKSVRFSFWGLMRCTVLDPDGFSFWEGWVVTRRLRRKAPLHNPIYVSSFSTSSPGQQIYHFEPSCKIKAMRRIRNGEQEKSSMLARCFFPFFLWWSSWVLGFQIMAFDGFVLNFFFLEEICMFEERYPMFYNLGERPSSSWRKSLQ